MPKSTKEPKWIVPGRMPISIPGHKTINQFTARRILDDFEADLNDLEDNQ